MGTREAMVGRAKTLAGPTPGVSRARKRWALAIAALVDAIQLGLFPAFVGGAAEPPDLAADVAAAVVLLFVLGFHWRLALAFAVELVPGADLFPSWTMMVLSLPVREEALGAAGGGAPELASPPGEAHPRGPT